MDLEENIMKAFWGVSLRGSAAAVADFLGFPSASLVSSSANMVIVSIPSPFLKK